MYFHAFSYDKLTKVVCLGKSRIELSFWGSPPRISIRDNGIGDDYDLSVAMGLGPSIYLGINHPWLRRKESCPDKYVAKQIYLSFFEGSLNWEIWTTDDGWTKGEYPSWRQGYCNFADLIFGDRKYSEEIVEQRKVMIRMPEGDYPAEGKLQKDQWKRPRWPWALVITRAHIDLPNDAGIPFPGKGESSWNCGDDATYGSTAPAESLEDGATKLANRIVATREKYGGKDWEPREDWAIALWQKSNKDSSRPDEAST